MPAPTNACGLPSGPSVSDQSLAYMADQPAGPVSCGYAQVAVKCGEHEIARRIFDKCIAKGYAGAMIWKGLMLEDGQGGTRDEAAAAALYRRAAESGEGHYAALGKLHYASALHQGKGVPKDEAEARRWFERAAAEGSEDAAEFLRTGYHTGSRDAHGHGVGVATQSVKGQALVKQSEAVRSQPWHRQSLLLAALLLFTGLGAWRQQRTVPRLRP